MQDRYNRGQATGLQQGNLAQAQQAFAKDPWFSLGHTIGTAWADNYNDRGISKGRGEMNEALNGYLGQFAQQPKTEVEQGGVLNNAMTGTQPSEEMLNNNSAQIQGGVLNGVENMIAPMSPQDAYKAYKNDAWVSKYRGEDPNPDSTAIAVKNDTREINQLGDNVNFDNVDKEQAREYVRQQLEAKGRTPYQIDQVLGQFDSIYDSKYNKWNEAKGTDYLNKGMEALNGENPDYNTAFNNFAAAAQRGNKQAQMQLQRLQYLQARQDKIDAENRAYQRQMDMLNYKRSLGVGTGRGSSGGGSGVASASNGVVGTLSDGTPYTLDMYKADVDTMNKFAGVDLEDPRYAGAKAIYDRASARILQLGFGVNFGQPKQEGGNAEPQAKPKENAKQSDTSWLSGSDKNTDDDNYESGYEYGDYGDLIQDLAHRVPFSLAMDRARKRTGIGDK